MSTILLCEPSSFDVTYKINPWMQPGAANRSLAAGQWANLRAILETHADVLVMQSDPTVPDLIFTANAGIFDRGLFIPSIFRYDERKPETEIYEAWAKKNGYKIERLPLKEGEYFEGAGDCLYQRGAEIVWMGYGFRTSMEAGEYLSVALDALTVRLQLIDPKFYHLDTAFCPLENGYILWNPAAFDERSRNLVYHYVSSEKLIPVDQQDADYFACNAVNLGDLIVVNNCTEALEKRLNQCGFRVIRSALDQFLLSGGGAKCLTVKVDDEV